MSGLEVFESVCALISLAGLGVTMFFFYAMKRAMNRDLRRALREYRRESREWRDERVTR